MNAIGPACGIGSRQTWHHEPRIWALLHYAEKSDARTRNFRRTPVRHSLDAADSSVSVDFYIRLYLCLQHKDLPNSLLFLSTGCKTGKVAKLHLYLSSTRAMDGVYQNLWFGISKEGRIFYDERFSRPKTCLLMLKQFCTQDVAAVIWQYQINS